ncbi:MAG: adenylate kinase [Candidatus Diapherotrites archaeon]|uniref:Adenylate kinase n=1 Tax=Candidatus Iainarchaeum sp. TaxID=3101447 RepID=A0A8T4LCI5_9ARCH|nr:adenylate kinase [Candidatus Diapherotrites archaeon]
MNIVLLGPPGTGKGTIAQFLHREYGFEQLSTGDLLRKEAAAGTPFGKQVEPIMKSGALVSNELVAEIVASNLARLKGKSLVLDGFPRNMEQAELFEKIMRVHQVKIDLALNVDSSRETVVRRLSARRQCPKCNKVYGENIPPRKPGVCDACGVPLFQRADDQPEVIEKRFSIYLESAKPLLAYYQGQGILKNVDGNQSVESVFQQVSAVLGQQKGL